MSNPVVEWIGPRRWLLHQPLTLGGFTVPAGFDTDGGSIPRILWWLFAPTGIYFSATILHDYFYRTKIVSRSAADRVFREQVIASQASEIVAWAFWLAVRIGGFWKYGRG